MGYFMFVLMAVGFFVWAVTATAIDKHDYHQWCDSRGGVTKYISDDDEACFVDGKVMPWR